RARPSPAVRGVIPRPRNQPFVAVPLPSPSANVQLVLPRSVPIRVPISPAGGLISESRIRISPEGYFNTPNASARMGWPANADGGGKEKPRPREEGGRS